MPPTEIRPDPRELAPIEEALHQTRAGLHVLDASVERLLTTAFRNGPLALQRLNEMVRHHGVEPAIITLEDRNLLRGREHIGYLRGSLMSPGQRRREREALDELKPALRQISQLKSKATDLERARHQLFEQADQKRLQEQDRDRPRPRKRGHKRSES